MKVVCPICQTQLKIHDDEEGENYIITTYICKPCKLQIDVTTEEEEE